MPRLLVLAFVLAFVLGACAGCTPPASPPARPPASSEPTAPSGTVEPQSVLPGLSGAELVAAIRTDYTPERTLGYGRARDLLFAYEMRTAGRLRDPYTGFELVLPPGEDASTAAYDRGVNTEHTWPQSRGARDEPLRSDLHHLFPVQDGVNSSRGNLPFGEVPDAQAEAWYSQDVSQSRPPAANAGRWSERGAGRWEPRDDARGNIARAVFYVYALYGPFVQDDGGAAFFSTMRADLLAWTRLDPADAAETARSAWIATQQGTPNPFVLDPTLAARAFGQGVPEEAGAPAPPGADSATDGRATDGRATDGSATTGSAAAASLWISALHYDNAGEDRGEGVGLSGLPGARLGGHALVLVNGSGGRVYRTVPLSGSLDGSGRAFVSVDGLQNGPADGVALVAPDGSVAEFVSAEGTVTATDGPAAGQSSADIGVAEDGRGVSGEWLLRDRRAGPWRLGTR